MIKSWKLNKKDLMKRTYLKPQYTHINLHWLFIYIFPNSVNDIKDLESKTSSLYTKLFRTMETRQRIEEKLRTTQREA